jgi:hypothetical protein
MSNADLVYVMLHGNIGPNTLAIASQVCKTWREVCSMEAVMRAAALYTGGVTRGVFCGMFAVSFRESRAFPHEERKSGNGRTYYLYSEKAVDAMLAAGAALSERRRRLIWSTPPPSPRTGAQALLTPPRYLPERWEVEERLHARAEQDAKRCRRM